MRYEGETGAAPWNDEGSVRPSLRPVRGRTAWEDTPNLTEVPVPGDPTPCSVEVELWFGSAKEQDEASYACGTCWMRVDCREYGIEHPDEAGVWGGLSQRQRRFAYRSRRGQAGGTSSKRHSVKSARSKWWS